LEGTGSFPLFPNIFTFEVKISVNTSRFH
jgi:hypothetical protein